MTPSIEAYRKLIIETYPGSTKWSNKVKMMSDNQIVAIFLRFRREGKIKI